MVDPGVETRVEGPVGLIVLDSPETKNALNQTLAAALVAALDGFDEDPEVRCIVISGAEGRPWFASGADIAAIADGDPAARLEPLTALFERIADCETPLVAAVSGFALGSGCELALACDLIVASETAEFGQPEITLGLIPGGGATQRLTRAVGKARAMELILTGRRFTALEAQEMGLVNEVAKKRAWLDRAREIAAVIAARPPLAARLAKRAVLAADNEPLDAGIAEERRLLAAALASEDRVEAITALIEKRRPRFTGT